LALPSLQENENQTDANETSILIHHPVPLMLHNALKEKPKIALMQYRYYWHGDAAEPFSGLVSRKNEQDGDLPHLSTHKLQPLTNEKDNPCFAIIWCHQVHYCDSSSHEIGKYHLSRRRF
jgi:hypothetical protein